LVFASLAYDEPDYIRDYQEFLAAVRSPANATMETEFTR
jgi:hypothetical protein